MVREWRTKIGLKEPDYALDDGFKTIVWRTEEVDNEGIVEATGEVTGEVKRVVLVIDGEVKRAEIEDALQLKHQVNFRDNYLLPSIEKGYVEMTIPEAQQVPTNGIAYLKKEKN